MKAGDELLSVVFSKDHRYIIPIFQRPYVWNEESNWMPLWEDLRKAAEQVEQQSDEPGDDNPPECFLGAFVTQHRSPIPRRKPTSMVIDGQQRMTTLQVFLAAAWRVAAEIGATQAADNFASLVRNRVSGDSDFPDDRFKVTPLEHDRAAFEWALREPADSSPRPSGHRLTLAAVWFEAVVKEWALESATPDERLDLLHFAVENRVKVVSIFLDSKDDPQVIFEALNHRGVRLDAADLVKNLLFQTLDRQGHRNLQGHLLNDHWATLDDEQWRTPVTTGRIKRVRVDILLAYWLSSQRGEESSAEHLFEDFKRWLRNTEADAADVIRSIRVYANTMDELQSRPMSSPVAQVLDRIEATSTTTPWPLILFLHAEPGIPEDQAAQGVEALDSFLMRRAVCGLTTKDYNRLFGTILGAVKGGERSRAGDLVVANLAAQTADSRSWPDDRSFLAGLQNKNLYNAVYRARLRTLLVGLENALLSAKAEPTIPHRSMGKVFTVEHVMPRKWEKNWTLPESASELEVELRQDTIHSLGNLTLATQSLNSTLSNAPWSEKRHTLQSHSLARLTTGSVLTTPPGVATHTQDEWVAAWDEVRIAQRGAYLADLALDTWRRPSDFDADLATEAAIDANEVTEGRGGPGSAHGELIALIVHGLIVPGDSLRHLMARSGQEFVATITQSGDIETIVGTFRSPSSALTRLVGSSRNGWKDWTHVPTGRTLDELRGMVRQASPTTGKIGR